MVRIALISFAAIAAIACDPAHRQNINAPDATAAAINVTVAVRSLSITGMPPVSGGTSQLTATATFSDGSSRDVTSIASWDTSDPAVLTISRTGMATGVNGGHALAKASYEGANAVLDLNVVIALPPPPSVPPPANPAEIINCQKQADDASDLKRTLYMASYPRTSVSQVDLGFTSKDTPGTYRVKLEVLADKTKIGETTVTILVETRRKLAAASFVFTPALTVPQGAALRFVASSDSGPAFGELSWEGTTDSKCPVIVTSDSASTTPITGPSIPVRILGS